jgi:acetyl-CoA carboxylase carboxyl transferase subunit beta
MCPNWECLGFTRDGGNAEYLKIPERNCLKVPDQMSFEAAALSTDAFGTLYTAVKKLGISEAVVTGSGDVEGIRVVFSVMDFAFLGGSLSSGAGEKIDRAIQHAIDFNRTFVMVSASGGARMHEGILSLMQMAKTCAALQRLERAGLPYVSILTDPTTGGVSASYALLGDVNLAEPGTLIGFAGRRVIETTIKQKLPDDFQTAEYQLEHGFVDAIVPRKELKARLAQLLAFRMK